MAERTKIRIEDKIRVTEICKLAEITKPTFYYHFRDKYDLAARSSEFSFYLLFFAFCAFHAASPSEADFATIAPKAISDTTLGSTMR